jgi:hypothetical protein
VSIFSRNGGSSGQIRLPFRDIPWSGADVAVLDDVGGTTLVVEEGTAHSIMWRPYGGSTRSATWPHVNWPQARVWPARARLPAKVEMDGDRVVRIVVPLSGDDAVRALGPRRRLAPVPRSAPVPVSGTVWVGRGAAIIPAALYAALAPRGGLVARRYDSVLEITPSHAAPRAVPLPSGRLGILADVPPEVSGEFDATVIRARNNCQPRLVVCLSGATSGQSFDPSFTALIRDALSGDEAARRAVGDALLAVARHVVAGYQLSEDDRAELVADLVAQAWEILPRRANKSRAYWTVRMRGWVLRALSGPQSATAVLASRANSTVPLDWRDAPVVGGFGWVLNDLLDRELLPLERRLAALLADGWLLDDLARNADRKAITAILERMRPVVARALDEAGAPPFRPSQRQVFRTVRVPVQ